MTNTDLVIDHDTLTLLFADEDRYGVNSDGEVSLFPDGTHVVICSNWAAYVRRVLGDRAVIYGFFEDDNPSSAIAQACGGHDFAVVDERWIVDGWVMNVESMADKAVFDLEADEDREVIRSLFGDRLLWRRSDDFMQSIDGEVPSQRTQAFNGTCFAHAAMPALPRL